MTTQTTKPKSPLHFARFEFKYLLSSTQREEVERDLLYFLDYDPFVADRKDHKYFVRSLYYDDPGYTAFHDKIDGLHSRSKFRIRTYSRKSEVHSPLFLEIKGRHNNLVFKHRTPVRRPHTDWSQLEGFKLSEMLLSHGEQSEVLDQFHYNLFRKNLYPVALIDYQRRPYISRFDPSFRITFDEQLLATNTSGLFPGGNVSPREVVSGYTIVEVKFRHHLPAWFHQVIQAHELKRISISKIVSGMERLHLAHDEH